jgi:hypothetical protein
MGDLALTTEDKSKEMARKRNLEGTNLNLTNSFSTLCNDEIAALSVSMGIDIREENFEVFDLMKDLEMARHALESKKINSKSDNSMAGMDEGPKRRTREGGSEWEPIKILIKNSVYEPNFTRAPPRASLAKPTQPLKCYCT